MLFRLTSRCLRGWAMTAVTATGVAVSFGCSGSGQGSSGTDQTASLGQTQEAVMGSVCECASTARECFHSADGDAGVHECKAEFKTCETAALAALKQLEAEIKECRSTESSCLEGTRDAGFSKVGWQEREACVKTANTCIEAALPPPPPCIQKLEQCVENGGDRWKCLDEARQCVRGTATTDAGAP